MESEDQQPETAEPTEPIQPFKAPPERGPKRREGRPSKFSPETVEPLLRALRGGVFMKAAVAFSGISPDTLYAWLKKGRRATSGEFHQFVLDVDRAIAESEVRPTLFINQAGQTDWRAAAWALERRHAQRWGRRDRVTVDGKGPGGAIQHRVETLKIEVVPSNVVDAEGRVVKPSPIVAPVVAAAVASVTAASESEDLLTEIG